MEAEVKIWEEIVQIPTYEVGKPDKNPIFLEKRVYQGSSGKVYPHSIIDKIYDEKVNKDYQAVFLENEYLKVMILPELGGRIHRALDKTNDYDFIYYNHVIKPALVGLCGPWISGGIEFNWPQHHRPSTFDKINYNYEEKDDGSATVWVGEIENMFRTKVTLGITLYPGKAYIELSARLYNGTNRPQTFLWWANPAVPANDYTKSIFPPDVHAVMDHGKRDVSAFPIAKGTYYKVDYSAGVDISRYKNIPVPTSYMASHSDFDFVGGYDYKKEAGILHVANHHISPGKKQWTWGNGEFGKAWDKNLTDEDGPYIELMTGCFTDNQPDFSWMAPYEVKTFTQYFMPIKGTDEISNANKDCVAGIKAHSDRIDIKVYTTGVYEDAFIILKKADKKNTVLKDNLLADNVLRDNTSIDRLFWENITLTPEKGYVRIVENTGKFQEEDLELLILDGNGKSILTCRPNFKETTIQEPAKAAPLPKEVNSLEDLYLYGQHLEQYRHATYDAADYYKEGLARDESDIRLNNAYGSLLLNRGLYVESEIYFKKAIAKLTRSNPNPYDSEAYFNLGIALKYQKAYEKAYDAFYKATWNASWQAAGFYNLACLDAIAGNLELALEHLDKSLVYNYHNIKARNLKAAVLRTLEYKEAARAVIKESSIIDKLNFKGFYEAYLLEEDLEEKEELMQHFIKQMNGLYNTYIEVALAYMEAGFFNEAIDVLKIGALDSDYPMLYYHMGYAYESLSNTVLAKEAYERAEKADSAYCFPHRIEDILALEGSIKKNTNAAKARYYLGCLWYDKKQYDRAISNFEISKGLDGTFPTVYRNLGLAYYNKLGQPVRAKESLEKAYSLDESDARVLMELEQLYKKLGVKTADRLSFLEKHIEQVNERDDLFLEYITLINEGKEYERALTLLVARKFHPWEGGEGRVVRQYLLAMRELAKSALKQEDYHRAIRILENALGPYPENFGEGRLQGTKENDLYYYLGLAYQKVGRKEKAEDCFINASQGIKVPASVMYYNDQPPETIYYQGLALMERQLFKEAKERFYCLMEYGKKHINDSIRIDYFAVSLPDLQIFDEDLNLRNKKHCEWIIELGENGMKQLEAYTELKF